MPWTKDGASSPWWVKSLSPIALYTFKRVINRIKLCSKLGHINYKVSYVILIIFFGSALTLLPKSAL